MKLRIPAEMIERRTNDLVRARSREVGGVLFGEQLSEGDFRIVEMTRQCSWGGTAVTFRRRGRAARNAILALHKKYGGDPFRFNYLGEWHSHPHAPAWPSPRDEVTMYQLLADQGDAVNFLVLMILKLHGHRELEIGATAYLSTGQKVLCEIDLENCEVIDVEALG